MANPNPAGPPPGPNTEVDDDTATTSRLEQGQEVDDDTATTSRPTETLSWTYDVPQMSFKSFTVDDLETGAYRAKSTEVAVPDVYHRFGKGRLDAAELADLRSLLAAADLRSQPPLFSPPTDYARGTPVTRITFGNAAGKVSIEIVGSLLQARAGRPVQSPVGVDRVQRAPCPPGLSALVGRLGGLAAKVPMLPGKE